MSSRSSDIEKANIITVEDSNFSNREKSGVFINQTSNEPLTEEYIKSGDEALKFVANNDVSAELDPATDKKLLRKIDMYLMPVMCILYCFQFMDKMSNSYAALLGLRKDLKMVGTMYSWTGSAFYIGYLFFEYPAVRLLQRYPVGKTVSIFIIAWGAILALHAVPNYEGFIALRTILGMLEASVTPAFVIITGQYYRKEEVFLRTACWFSANGLGTILGGGIAYGLAMGGNYPIEAWKLVFIITGCLTCGLGIFFFVYLPDSPANAWFLNDEDKKNVVIRIRANQQGFGNRTFKLDQFKEAFTDRNTWLLLFFGITNNIPNGGITNFGAILLNGKLGYSVQYSLLLQMPGGAFQVISCIGLAFIAQYFNSKLPMAIFATCVSIMATCFIAFADGTATQLAGLILWFVTPLGMICSLSCVSSNVAGHTKKTTVNALFLISYCVGNLIGPQTFLDNEKPGYKTATTCMVAFSSASLVALVALYASYKIENKKRDQKMALSQHEYIENMEFADMTDTENPFFRYST